MGQPKMKTNSDQKMEEEVKIIDAETLEIDAETEEKEREQLEDLIDSSFDEPTKPIREFREAVQNKKSREYKFYYSCLTKIPQWWDEWNTSLDEKTCTPKYRSVFQFAKAKGTNVWERDLIYEMIGPEPNKAKLRVPWLGDWKRRRMSGFYTPVLNSSIKKLAIACRDQLEAVQAVKSTAPYLVHELGLYSKMSEEISTAFNGSLFETNREPYEYKNLGRAKAYITLQKSVTRMKLELLDKWCAVHGLNMEAPEQFVQLNQQINVAQVHGGMDSMTQSDVETLRLARMLKSHAETFNMPLPEKPDSNKMLEGEVTHKTNGREKIQ